MWKTKLCLGLSEQYGISYKEQIQLFKTTGFDAFFVNWTRDENIKELKEYADSLGMIFQSIHAPFYGDASAADMWKESPHCDIAIRELLDCLKDCADNNVPIMVCHAFIGFEDHTTTPYGIENYGKIVEKAKEYGVKIAFENTEGEEYLFALMDAFKDCDNVGFCWDTGHEMCYNHSKDLMALFGDRLICTHLNDNLGIKDFGGEIIWSDDLHLLPFDGIADWNDITTRLNKYGYNDILTFELNTKSKPDRHENDVYDKMPIEEYISEVYKRACRVGALKERNR